MNDFILGATITGTSETTGSTEIVLRPNSQEGQLELHFSGVISYRTVANSGPVQVFADGAARFATAKAVRIDQGGIAAGPAATSAQCFDDHRGAIVAPRLVRPDRAANRRSPGRGGSSAGRCHRGPTSGAADQRGLRPDRRPGNCQGVGEPPRADRSFAGR